MNDSCITLFNAKKGSLNWEDLPKILRKVIIDTFLIEPSYAVYNISEWGENRWLLHFGIMGSFSISASDVDIMVKHNMNIQVPGNQEYLWSLSISESI